MQMVSDPENMSDNVSMMVTINSQRLILSATLFNFYWLAYLPDAVQGK